MITAIVDSQHKYFDYYNELSKNFDLKEGFDESESFIKIIAQDVLSRMNKLESSTQSKLLALINFLSTKVNKNDFIKFASIENKKSKGGIRTISVPEQDIDEHLLMWSNMYGVILISREAIHHERTSKVEGEFLIAFDTIPPFILLTNTENPEGHFKIIHDSGNREKDEHLSEILAEFSRMIFPKWEKYGNEMSVENQYEFSFIMNNVTIEC